MPLPVIPHDKAMHAIYGVLAGLVGAVAAQHIGILPWQGAAGLAVLVGVAKEIADKYVNSQAIEEGEAPTRGVEVGDVVATAAGGVAIALGTLL